MTTAGEIPPFLANQSSTTSLRSGRLTATVPSTNSRSSSTSSIPFADGEVDVVTEEGLRHSPIKLEARKYKSLGFATNLLDIVGGLQISSWRNAGIEASEVKIVKVAGSLTNAVFFVSCSKPHTPTLLLRIYGPSSGELISRPRELHTLHVLSSQYHIGPKVYGTFENGRVEEYFDSTTLTAADLRNPQISRWIGARMAELHFVDIEAVEETSPETQGEGRGWEIGATKNVRSWVKVAREVLALPAVSAANRKALDLDAFILDWEKYTQWLTAFERANGVSPRVYAHNDAQYGNLLRLTNVKPGTPEHRQIIVVDFEYASPNPAAFDIANHFHEWTANYHSSTPHILDAALYPTPAERSNFYAAYLEHSLAPPSLGAVAVSGEMLAQEAQVLEARVRAWSPASHAMWAVWGIVQAREDVEGAVSEPEFDYIGYAKCRMEGFRREISLLGL
ncbi:hypothetical protein PLICRDRAFT_171144 [Plicaturopsis crispa FD-325 SS-3]|nr:hypothetical protein PLICRDRAFT_171144 [Plicaturopsis crispa FD-325 SS-3]